MTKEEIIELARMAECEETFGTDAFRFTIEELECFANIVAAKERERCANKCEALCDKYADVNAADCTEEIRSLK